MKLFSLLVLVLSLACNVRASSLPCFLIVRGSPGSVLQLVEIPCELWIGVHSRAPLTWSSADGGDNWTATVGTSVVAGDGIAYEDDMVFTCSIPPGSTVQTLQFQQLGTAPGGMDFSLAPAPVSATSYFALTQSSGGFFERFAVSSIAGTNAVGPVWNTGLGAVTRVQRGYAYAPCSSPSPGGGFIPFPSGYRFITEFREYTYTDETGNFVAGPGSCMWRGVGWFSTPYVGFFRTSTPTAYGVSTGAWQFIPRTGVPGCSSLTNPINASIEALAGGSVFEVRMYAGRAVGLTASGEVFAPGDFPTGEDVPVLDQLPTADWWTKEYAGDPSVMQPGTEGGFPDSPLTVPDGWFPKGIGDGESVPEWTFFLPLSNFSSLPDQTYTVDFGFAEPIRPIIRLIPLLVVFVMGAAAVWEELRRY